MSAQSLVKRFRPGSGMRKRVGEVLVHGKAGFRIVFVPDLVDFFLLTFTGKKLVGGVVDDSVGRANVLVGVNYARGDYSRGHPVLADVDLIFLTVGRRCFPVVPEIEPERGGSQKTEQVGLMDVLVRSPGDPRFGQRDIAHDRVIFGRDFIVPKQLYEPATIVVETGQLVYNNVAYGAIYSDRAPPWLTRNAARAAL